MVIEQELFKQEKIEEHRLGLHQLIREQFLFSANIPVHDLISCLDDYVKETNKFFKTLDKDNSSADIIRIVQEHVSFRKIILARLIQWAGIRVKTKAEVIFAGYETRLQEFLQTRERQLIMYQTRERFISDDEDSLTIRSIKFVKRVGYFLAASPTQAVNFFRRWLKKPAYPLPVWKQKIPLHHLSLWYYGNHFIKQYADLQQNILQRTTLIANDFWLIDQQLFEHYQKMVGKTIDLDSFSKEWENNLKHALLNVRTMLLKAEDDTSVQFESLLATTDQLFKEQLQVAGTLEFNSSKHRKARRIRNWRKTRKVCTSHINMRYNTMYVLADDWKFNQEIYILKDKACLANLLFEVRMFSRADVIHTSMINIQHMLNKTLESIHEDPFEQYRKNLVDIKNQAAIRLNAQLIPEITNLILEQGFPLIIDETELGLVKELDAMSNKRILIDGFDPSREYSDKSLHSVSLLELVDFEMMDELKKVLRNAKIEIIEKLEDAKAELENLGRMVIYNLDSAIAMLDEQGGQGVQASYMDARGSMDRAIQNTSELQVRFDAFIKKLTLEFAKASAHFSSQLTELTNNSRVTELRYRIARAKALRKSEQIIVSVKDISKRLLEKSQLWFNKSRLGLVSGINFLKDQLGIQHVTGDISLEISDYLVSGDTALQKMPFVYRRLFVNEPLKETTFYLPRKQEFAKMDRAFSKWQYGSFTPVLIYGERGSGISTFVHLFVKEKIPQHPVVYSVLAVKRIQNEVDLLSLLGISFRGESFATLHELYDFVEGQESFVAFVDKLHLFFLRQPGGFNILKKLFEIISNTSRKIFWICTCGVYASEFLNKAIGLFDYFPVLIPMGNISKEDVRRVIMLRHRASGYDLHFKPSENDLNDRSYNRKNLVQQQEYLKERYFETLQSLTQSNIAFALQLWLRSAEKPLDNKIHLNSLGNLDFSFMLNMPGEVIFGLHAVVIHEKLDIFQLSQVLSISRRQSSLLLMRLADRGIITEDKGFYSIHPLLYRQTIMLLRFKNLIN